jgi:hypothetical protein
MAHSKKKKISHGFLAHVEIVGYSLNSKAASIMRSSKLTMNQNFVAFSKVKTMADCTNGIKYIVTYGWLESN